MAFEYFSFGQAVWWNRRINRITQAKLAERAGCSARMIYAIEHNKYIDPPREMVSRFAAALNVDAVKLDPWFHTDDLLNDLLNNLISNVDIYSDSICEDALSLDMLDEILNSPDMDESPTFAI